MMIHNHTFHLYQTGPGYSQFAIGQATSVVLSTAGWLISPCTSHTFPFSPAPLPYPHAHLTYSPSHLPLSLLSHTYLAPSAHTYQS